MADPHPEPRQTEAARQVIARKEKLVGFAFRVYKSLLSPVLHAVAPSRCIFLPTCSEYAYTATSRFGIVRGAWMALRRFARCHPWGRGGFDPVPERSPAQLGSAQAESSVSRHNGTDHLS